MTKKTLPVNDNQVSEAQVVDYLRQNADFLKRHPELLQVLNPLGRELGDVADFQQFQLKKLQDSQKHLKNQYETLVDFCRENLSVQRQVHEAVLMVAAALTLEQLLEVISGDLARLFNVDVVRLAVESHAVDEFETNFGDQNYSGIVLILPGLVDMLVQTKKQVVLVEDMEKVSIPGFEDIFADCADIVQSCALLRLELPSVERAALLAFGVRSPGRFNPQQGIDLLLFLAQLLALKLDRFLLDNI